MAVKTFYDASKDNISLEAEINRLRNQANMNTEKEGRALTAFGLRDGMSLLEVGSGPGCVTEWLSRLVPNASITCLEIDPLLVSYARQTLEDKVNGKCNFVEGSAMDMNLPDNSFDFAYVRLVFEHIPNPVAAAKEILRVLRPGGKVVLAEGDYALNSISNPFVPEAEAIREKIMRFKAAHGSNHMSARRAWYILKTAGFENIDLEAVVFHSGEKGLDWFYPQFDPGRVKPLVKMGLVFEEEYDGYCNAVDRFQSSEEAFFLRIFLMACGQKPQLD